MAAHKTTYAWIAIALALYLFFSLTCLELPGLQYDEANFVNAAMGKVNDVFVTWNGKLFGKKVPLMVMSYIGAVKSALYFPIFRIFGTGAIAARLPVVLIGLITLLVACALFWRMFNERVAVVGLWLFATDPTFIFANKLDWGPVSLMLALEVSSLYFLWRWLSEKKRHLLALAGFLFGLGLYNKVIFAWYLVSVFIALFLFFRQDFKQLLGRRCLAWFLPAFLLGCLPLIAFNIAVPLGTFSNQQVLTRNWTDALVHRYHLFRGTLDGGGIYFLVNQEDVAYPSSAPTDTVESKKDAAIRAFAGISWVRRSLLPVILVASLALILILCCLKRLRKKREILFLVTQLVFIAVFIYLTPESGGAHHVIVCYPFVFITVAFAICELASCVASEFASKTLVALCLVPAILPQLVIDARYLKSFKEKGGVGYWSDAIYELSAFARKYPDKNFILMEWGLGNQLALLSGGRVRKEEFACRQEKLEACMEPLFARTDSLLVFYAPPFEARPMLQAFKQALAQNHLQRRILKTFYQRDGRPVYVVYQIVNPVQEAYTEKGSFFYLREGEDYDAKSGGDLDRKAGASNKKALGCFWGRKPKDFASYKFTLSRSLADVHLYLHYAFKGTIAQQYNVLLDGNFADTIMVPPTGGFGDTPDQWKTFGANLGDLAAGSHELTLKPAKTDQVLNLDYFYLSEGEFRPEVN